MHSLARIFPAYLNLLALFFTLLIFTIGTPCWAEDLQSSTAPPSVFHPQETQHGFSEFDSPPDFFEDESPTENTAPYKEYSDSPQLPSLDHKPGGLFESLVFAESIEEDRTIRRGHILVPVNPAEAFPASIKAVHLVFTVHDHLAPYQIIGRLFPEEVPNMDANQWIDEDRADLALEDISGYLKFFAPNGTWHPGRYRVDIYVGYMVNTMNKMGTMRFHIDSDSGPAAQNP